MRNSNVSSWLMPTFAVVSCEFIPNKGPEQRHPLVDSEYLTNSL